ncbi:18055_t:CDS:2 [Acaulospora morrowiae]|uniref:18055_t:CDS:1 n=1 Tax=Acaulospora morrowiae TaxID=94023 RepID=A0A9N8ZHE7_9GLOM|nr:18055_t:CDS:2 [Acaulospora morrowiae]
MGNKIFKDILRRLGIASKPNNNNRSDDSPYLLYTFDDAQMDRMQIRHNMYRTFYDGNYKSPIEDQLTRGNFQVLDVGTCPVWSMDMATSYPNSQFTALDIFNVYPKHKPRNVTIIHCDILRELPFESNSFDYIHLSHLVIHLNSSQLEGIFEEIARILKPGGYLECFDTELPMYNSPPYMKNFFEEILRRLQSRNIYPLDVLKFEQYILNTEVFENIKHEKHILTMKDEIIGKFLIENVVMFVLNSHESIDPSLSDDAIQRLPADFKLYNSYIQQHRYIAVKSS